MLAASLLAAIAWLISWQIKRQGVKPILQNYSFLLIALLAFHFLLPPEPQQEQVPTQTVESEIIVDEQGSNNEDRLNSLASRLNGHERSPVVIKALEERAALEVVEEGDPYSQNNLLPIIYGALAFLVVVYFVRAHPEKFEWNAIKHMVGNNKWIRPNRSKNNELGSSDFATPQQIKEWLKTKDQYDTKLPVSDLRGSSGIVVKNGTLHIPRGERNRHMLIVAKTGSGKTTKMILPILYNDCLCPHRSTIIIDSKQEMWSKLAGMTRKYNPEKNIMMFNPLDTLRSLSWNILDKVETDTDCKLIANSVIMATDEPQAKQDSPFFRNSALQVLNALMVGLMHDPEEKLSMPRIHELLNHGMQSLCDWLEAHPHAIRTSKAFVELARSGSQNADTIMSELSMRLQAWDLKAIRATTFENEIDLERIIKEPSLFVVELRESELKMLRPLANVIVVELLRYLTKYAEECPGQSLPRPVGLVIDEFASALGRLPDIHIKLNTLRSRNVSIVAAIQSIGQIKGNYGEDWESVLSGFSTKVFMPSLDYMDSEWASKESGMMTVRYRTMSKGNNRKITENFSHRNTGVNEQIQQRQVLTPGEVGRPSDNQATFFLPETPVFQGHLTPFYKVPEMLKRITELSDPEHEVMQREAAIEYQEVLPEAVIKKEGEDQGQTPQAANDDLSEDELRTALEEIKAKRLDWENTTGDARRWWEAFEEENKTRLALVLKVAQEIVDREATITDFFLAYVYSNTDNIQATLAYLDYTMHMKTAESA